MKNIKQPQDIKEKKLKIRLLEIEKEELENSSMSDWGRERVGEILREIDELE